MRKHRRIPWVLSALVLTMALLAGCGAGQGDDIVQENGVTQSQEEGATTFSDSDGIDDNGYWKGINALDHVELFDYQGMPIPKEVHEISQETVQNEVDSRLGDYLVNQQILDRPVENGDTVNIDYVGSVDGVEFAGGTTSGAGTDVTIGVTSYIDDFLEQLIGHSPGETINVEVTFPENYGVEDLNGQDALFVTTINYIVETVSPELNDEFVAENFQASSGWSTVEELNQGVSDQLQNTAILGYTQEYLMDHATVVSVPEEVVNHLERSLVSFYQNMADSYGVEIGEIIGMYENVTTVEELLERYHDANLAQANYYLVIQAIAEDAGITAGDGNVAAYFANMGNDDYTQFEEQYGMPYLKQVTLNQMVLDYLVDHATLE